MLRRALRRTHQTVASQLASASGPANDGYLHSLYEDLMTQDHPTGRRIQQEQTAAIDTLLAGYAKRGNVRDLEVYMSRMLSAPPTEHQRDLHVKAHISTSSLSTTQRFPTGALAVLHQYEASGHPASIKSYTRVISALFNVQTSPTSDPGLGHAAAQAQAWDLFAHMRYVVHPVPDAHLYALMIRACGSFSRPEPERALDLWTEMRENGVKPTQGAYEAVIRVCGRGGPEWLGEGMRLAREMSEKYPITGTNGRGLWCALLEGCKRAGNLQKARWILAEAVRGSDSRQPPMVDAELMTHIFHTYASYKPPFRRETTRLVDGSAVSTDEAQSEEMSNYSNSASRMSAEQTKDDFPDVPVESVPSFSRLPPQTSFDVIAEARTLFNRILDDRSLSLEQVHNANSLVGRFAQVELTPALLNAYLSVFYKHASIEAARETFDFLFNVSSAARVPYPDEYTYINTLQRCGIARTEDRHLAVQWAKDVWRRWEEMEAKCVRDGKGNVGSFARSIEKAHAAMRRALLRSGDIDGALTLLRSFVSRYPPNAVLQSDDSQRVSLDRSSVAPPAQIPLEQKVATVGLFAKPPILSTRTILTNPAPSTRSTARPLVRLTSVVTPKDDRVPPIIGFSDVDLLHARLAERGRIKDLGYIKWVCLAYANALKKRREAFLKAVPTRQEDEVD